MSASWKFGVLGRNIAYSRSPAIFNVVFQIEQVAGQCDILDVEPEQFETQVGALAAQGYDGLSVTVPYKQAIMQYLNEVDVRAEAIGAVNSITIKDGRISGFNTDGQGFVIPLLKHRDRLADGRAVLIGCGGAARAVAYCLIHDLGMKDIVVVGRNARKLDVFGNAIDESSSAVTVTKQLVTSLDDWALEGQASLIVNCTPLGGGNHADESPLPKQLSNLGGTIYYDLNYNADNRALRQAGEAGMTVIDGRPMLVGQALASLKLWTGRDIPFDAVYEKVNFDE